MWHLSVSVRMWPLLHPFSCPSVTSRLVHQEKTNASSWLSLFRVLSAVRYYYTAGKVTRMKSIWPVKNRLIPIKINIHWSELGLLWAVAWGVASSRPWWCSDTSRWYAQKMYHICLTAAYWTNDILKAMYLQMKRLSATFKLSVHTIYC